MAVRVMLDALLIASVAGALLIGVVRLAHRWRPPRSGHVRHQLESYSLLASAAVLLAVLVMRPEPLGCLVVPCRLDPAGATRRAEASLNFSLAGAGKVTRIEPSTPVQPDEPPFRWPEPVISLWLVGAAFGLLRAARSRLAAFRLVRDSEPLADPGVAAAVARVGRQLGVRRPVDVRRHPRVVAPAVSGVFRAVLVLPAQFEQSDPAEIEMTLLHELAHLRRHDGWTALATDAATALFWFHPLMWSAVRRIRDLQEVAADSVVLWSGVLPSRYAQYLLDSFQALSGRPASTHEAHSMLGNCLMETRMHSILDPATNHRPPSRGVSLAIAAVFGLLTLALASAPGSLQAIGYLPPPQGSLADGPNRALLNQASIDALLRPTIIDKMADRYIPGSAIVVVSGDKIVYKAGFGRREVFQEVPVEVDRTIWRIGSITKVLTGIAVMQQVDQGTLSLDADVNQYLTAIKVPAGFDKPVRVRNLLTHTSGFDQPGLNRQVASQARVVPLGDFLSANLTRIRPPDEMAVYDTYGITLAGYLVEERSRMAYEQYLQRHLFEPLEMSRSGIVVPPALSHDQAVGYEFAGHFEAMPWEYMNTAPASTVNATATDMGNLLVMLLNNGRFKGRQVVSEQSVRAMMTRQFGNDPQQPGYGLTFWEDRAFRLPAFSHGGSMTGFGALLYLIPEHQLGVFIACNQETGELANAAVSKLVTSLFPKTQMAPEALPRFAAQDAARFAGQYANAVYNHSDPTRGWRRAPFDVTANDAGEIVFQRQPAIRVGPLAFQRKDGVLVTFREDAQRGITHMFVNQAVFERIK